MEKQKIKKFKHEIDKIIEDGTTIESHFDSLIYHMSQHDDMDDIIGFKNRIYFIYKLRNAFRQLDE